MTLHEFDDKNNPVIMLFPGTMYYWRGNFGGVIDTLAEKFLVSAVAYTGLDEGEPEEPVQVGSNHAASGADRQRGNGDSRFLCKKDGRKVSGKVSEVF